MSSFYLFNGFLVFSGKIKLIFLHADAFSHYLVSFLILMVNYVARNVLLYTLDIMAI